MPTLEYSDVLFIFIKCISSFFHHLNSKFLFNEVLLALETLQRTEKHTIASSFLEKLEQLSVCSLYGMVTIVDDDGIVSAVIEYLINDIEEIFILDIFIN